MKKSCQFLVVGVLGAALCLPGFGVTYTGGDCPAENLLHRWSFNGDARDSVGGSTASLGAAVTQGDQMVTITIGTAGTGFVDLGANMLPTDGSPVTIEIWATPHSFTTWSRVFQIGQNASDCLLLAWTRDRDSTDRIQITKGGSKMWAVENVLVGYTANTEYHISVTITPRTDGKADLAWARRDARTGAILKQGSGTTGQAWSIADIARGSFYLGHSLSPGDADAHASYNEVRVWKGALTPEQLTWSARLGADTLPTAAAAGAVNTTIAFDAESGGKVSANGAAASVSGTVTAAKNELVTLTAVPDANYHFFAWSGDIWAVQSGTASDASITVYAASAASFSASFHQNLSTWTGAGANDFWSTAANWQDSFLPVEHSQLVFNGNVQTANQNDRIASLDKLTFGADAASYTLTGNGVALGALENLSAATQTVDLAVSAATSTLPISNSGDVVFNQAVTAPALAFTGSGTTVFNQQVASSTQTLDANATAVFKGGINAGTADNYFKGGGTSYLNGTTAANSIRLQTNGTTLEFDGADTVCNLAADLTVSSATLSGETTTVNINQGTLTVGSNFLTDNSGGTGGGTAKAGGNGTVNQAGGDVTVGRYFIVGRDHVGTYNLTGGTLVATATGGDYAFLGEVGGSVGTLNVGGDSRLSVGQSFLVGRYGTGYMNVSGGEVVVPGWLSIAQQATGVGAVNVTGGKITQTKADSGLVIGDRGKGALNVSGTGVVDLAGVLTFARSAANVPCELNLTDGGTLKTAAIKLGNPSSFASMYVDDGTIVAKGSDAVLDNFINMPYFSVGPNGMTLDTQNNTVIVNRAFGAGSAGATITKTGSGTLCMPASAEVPVRVQEGALASMPAIADDSVNANLTAHLLHRWSFNGDFTDSVGGLTASSIGTTFVENTVRTTGGGSAASYVTLDPAALPKDRPFTIEIFATPRKIYSWSRIFSFGKGTPASTHQNNLFMSWTRGTNQNQEEIRFTYNGEKVVNADETLQPFTLNTKWHIALAYVPNVTADGKGRFFWSKTDMTGANHRESAAFTSMPVDFQTWGVDGFYLGRSFWTADGDAEADYDEVRIWDVALTPERLIANAKSGPDVLPACELLVHRWSFNGDAKDSIGGTTASLEGAVTQGDQMVSLTGGATGPGYVNLGANMLPTDGSPVTIEIWATPHSFPIWSRVFDIGPNQNNCLLLAWTQNTDAKTDRCQIMKGGTKLMAVNDKIFGYTLGAEYHIAVTITPMANGKASLVWARRDARTGALIKQGSGTTSAAWSLADIADGSFYLGHSQSYPTDADANASYNEVRVWKGALTDAQLSRSAALGPDVLPTESAESIAAVELAVGTTFKAQSGEVTVGKLSGVGTVSGAVRVVDTLDVAGEEVGTMTLNGTLAVKGTWLLDRDDTGCDLLTGSGTLDLSQTTIIVRDVTKLRECQLLATVGEVTGYKQATVSVKGYKLFYNNNRLTLARQGLCVFIR